MTRDRQADGVSSCQYCARMPCWSILGESSGEEGCPWPPRFALCMHESFTLLFDVTGLVPNMVSGSILCAFGGRNSSLKEIFTYACVIGGTPNRALPANAEWREFCRRPLSEQGYPMPKSAQRTTQPGLLIDRIERGQRSLGGHAQRKW